MYYKLLTILLMYYLFMQNLQESKKHIISWITRIYNSKYFRKKILHKFLKYWRSRLARLNKKFDTYIKENYKVVDYAVKKPSIRERNLTRMPYGYHKKVMSKINRRRCMTFTESYVIEARSAVQRRTRKMEFDTDSFEILIDNCCSHSLTNNKNDFIEPPVKSKVKVRGYNGQTSSTMVGTVKWKILDDNGKTHNLILPETYYSPTVETRLLSPQHWAQVRAKKTDTYCITYYDAIILRWNKDKYQVTAPLDDRKHRNVGVMRSVTGINTYLTSCTAYDQLYSVLAYPATISLEKESEPALITDDEASTQTPDFSPQDTQEPNTNDEQMREEPKGIIYDEDTHVREEYPVYATDNQEYMHWHYKLNHPTQAVIMKMAQQNMLPRKIIRILNNKRKKIKITHV